MAFFFAAYFVGEIADGLGDPGEDHLGSNEVKEIFLPLIFTTYIDFITYASVLFQEKCKKTYSGILYISKKCITRGGKGVRCAGFPNENRSCSSLGLFINIFFYFAVKKSGKQYLQNDQSHQILVKKLSEFCFSMVLKEVSILTRNLLG